MSMDVNVAALRIEREIKSFEYAIDSAIAAQSALAMTMVQARRDTETPAISGHVAFARLAKAGQALVAARAAAIRAHEDLFKVAEVHCDIPTAPKPNISVESFAAAEAA